MEFLWVTVFILLIPIWWLLTIIKKRQKMFIGNQWHIPTSKPGREEIIVRHEDLSELQWLAKRFPDRAFHVAYEDSTDQAIVYHRTSKEG